MKIFDSHIGSGSNRIAAYKANLDFVGCELDAEYYKAQEERFQKFISQLVLF
jgi:site-specific DNA-methyltransferase (adenine-specific)